MFTKVNKNYVFELIALAEERPSAWMILTPNAFFRLVCPCRSRRQRSIVDTEPPRGDVFLSELATFSGVSSLPTKIVEGCVEFRMH